MKFYSQFSEKEIEILEARAQRIAGVSQDKADEQLITALVIGIGSEVYALPIDTLKTVHEHITIVPVPCVPPYVAGVANMRGHIIPVLNLGILMHGVEVMVSQDNALIEVKNDTLTVAFLVETIGEIATFSTAALSAVPPEAEGRHAEYLRGVFPEGAGLIDVDAILNDEALTIMEKV
jgi:purine-binding chemotaxis protein CheW